MIKVILPMVKVNLPMVNVYLPMYLENKKLKFKRKRSKGYVTISALDNKLRMQVIYY